MGTLNRRSLLLSLSATASAAALLGRLWAGREDGPFVVERLDRPETIRLARGIPASDVARTICSDLLENLDVSGRKILVLLVGRGEDGEIVEALARGAGRSLGGRSARRLVVLHDRAAISAGDGIECVSLRDCPRGYEVELAMNASGKTTVNLPSCLEGCDLFVNLSIGGPGLPALGDLLATSDRPGPDPGPSGLDLLCDLAATINPGVSILCSRELDDAAGGYSILSGSLAASTDAAYNARSPRPDPGLTAILDALPSWLGCIEPANLRFETHGDAGSPTPRSRA